MVMPEFTNIKFEIPVHLQKAFAKGNAAKTYEEMSNVASRLTASDTLSFRALKIQEYFDNRMLGRNESRTMADLLKEIQDYEQERFKYHMQNLMHVFELQAAQNTKHS